VQLSLTDDRDDAIVTAAVDATNRYVRGLPAAQVDTDPAPADWTDYADVVLGANMLGARLVRRRNSPDGVQAMTEAGVAYVARADPDIAMLLQLGAYAPPSVG
jgi:hypothetical protein